MKTLNVTSLKHLAMIVLFCLGLSACSAEEKEDTPAISAAETCTFPNDAVVVKQDGPSILQYWEFQDSEHWMSSQLPADSSFLAYRTTIAEAGKDESRPAQFVPEGQQDSDMWRRELHNVEQAYSGNAGEVRPIRCLDALLFAFQNARFSQIEHPTEFIASILQKRIDDRTMLKVWFSASNTLFPPKAFYGFDEAIKDVEEDGWEYIAALHNHTLQDTGDTYRLGVTAPSSNDVQLLRGLAEDVGLQYVWVTNGFYTVEIPARHLGQYLDPNE